MGYITINKHGIMAYGYRGKLKKDGGTTLLELYIYNTKDKEGGFNLTKKGKEENKYKNLENVTFFITKDKNMTVGWDNYKECKWHKTNKDRKSIF